MSIHNAIKQPNVAILMATYNGEKFLQEQIDSIFDQQDINLTLFISDDNSSDGTLELIKANKSKHANQVHFLGQRMSSKGAADNFYHLINEMNVDEFDYFAFSDQDDIWPHHKISRAIQEMHLDNADGYSSDFIFFDETNRMQYFKKSYKQSQLDYFFETPGPGCSFVLTKKLFEDFQSQIRKTPVMKEFIYHDWLIYAYARSKKYRWMIDASPNLFYRQHGANVVGANHGLQASLRRINRIFFGQWYKEITQLINIIDEPRFKNKSNRVLYWFFLARFFQSRRNPWHAFLMIPFLLFIGIQKH